MSRRWQLDAVSFHAEADKKERGTLRGFASRVCLVHTERERATHLIICKFTSSSVEIERERDMK